MWPLSAGIMYVSRHRRHHQRPTAELLAKMSPIKIRLSGTRKKTTTKLMIGRKNRSGSSSSKNIPCLETINKKPLDEVSILSDKTGVLSQRGRLSD